jgi:EAL domain-containing protein (putative c-di-GMP-specific phosphodiesterase class I)
MNPPNLAAGNVLPAPPRPSVWFLAGEGDGSTVRHISLNTSPFSVGRLKASALYLGAASVSKCHAELYREGDDWYVRDLGSTNGTFVNDRRIAEPERLTVGDVLHFAHQEFRVGRAWKSNPSDSNGPGPLAEDACQFDKLFDEGIAVPYFQPIVSLTGSGLLGYEVLGRSLLDGLRNPAEMFKIAARLKQTGELSRHFRSLGVATGQMLPGTPNLFLNTHPYEIDDPQLLVSMHKLRAESPGQPLTLEVHESAVTSPELMKKLRASLKELDIRLAYDDFGSGQDRLLDLAEVPPDYLKFDACLIRDIHLAPASRRQMVSALVNLVRDLKIVPLAEGIETFEESEVCRALGFEYAQGFFYGRPAPADSHLLTSGGK